MSIKHAKLAVFTLLVGILLMGYSVLEIARVPADMQYIVTADPESELKQSETGELSKSQLKTRIDTLDSEYENLLTVSGAFTLAGTMRSVSVTAANASAAPGLIAIDARYTSVFPLLPRFGRLIAPEELDLGQPVAMIDEQLAIALFQMADVVDREVKVGGQTFRIVGVLQHQRRVGDDNKTTLYLPLEAVAKNTAIQLEALRLTAQPVSGGGTMPTFVEVADRVKPGGTHYDLRREKIAATIWARLLLCGLGLAVIGTLISLFVRSVIRLEQTVRQRLVNEYMGRILPYMLVRIVGLILWLAAMVAGIALLAQQALAPVYAFPEYVPAILVDPKSISETFWNLRQSEAAVMILRTRPVIRLIYFGGLCNIACIVILAGLAQLFAKRRKKANR